MPKIIFRIITTCAFLFLTTALANAQKYSITGTVCDNETQEKLGRATIQLLSREVNTISSKSQDIPITQLTVDMKAEIEKLREQVQNIE